MRMDRAAEPEAALARVRQTLYSLGRKSEENAPPQQALITPVDPRVLGDAMRALEILGETSDGKRICVGRLPAGSPLLREIGRLRELTFRAVGEGTAMRWTSIPTTRITNTSCCGTRPPGRSPVRTASRAEPRRWRRMA